MNSDNDGTVGGFVFVDESKAHDYLLIAAVVRPAQLAAARKAIRRLVLPGQRRIHMYKESDARRRQLLSVIGQLGIDVTIYRASRAYPAEVIRRDRCIAALVADATRARHIELIFELDASIYRRDQAQINDAMRLNNCVDRLAYRHSQASTEPLLIIPDAIGWAWAKGGDWRCRCGTVKIVDV